MGAIDVERMLAALPGDGPCGAADLEYDPAYAEMSRLAIGKPAQEMGGQTIPGEEPDWKGVHAACLSLWERTRDLRVAVYLTRALVPLAGLEGLADGLALNRGLVERYWEPVYPRLDPGDHNDPTIRVNALAALADREQMLATLRAVPLASSRRLGRFGLREVEIASGAIARPANADNLPDAAGIEAAFMDTDAAELQASSDACARAAEQLAALDLALDSAVGSTAGADFEPLRSTLRSIHHVLAQQLARRGLASAAPAAELGATAVAGGATLMPGISGTIQNREDIVRMLDQAIDWYARNEPSSPVPLLLSRAKSLTSKSFVDIVKDLTPSGFTEIQVIAGLDTSS